MPWRDLYRPGPAPASSGVGTGLGPLRWITSALLPPERKSRWVTTAWVKVGGDEEDRTPDLRIANATLSQLSYAPTNGREFSTGAAAHSRARARRCRARRTGVRHRRLHCAPLHLLPESPRMRPRLDPAWLDTQYNNRARVPDHAARPGAAGPRPRRWRARSSPAQLDLRYGTAPARRWTSFPATAPRRGGRAGAGLHPRRLLALARQVRPFLRRTVVQCRRRDGGGAQLRAVPGGEHRAHRAADGRGGGLGLAPCGRLRRRPRAHRAGRPLGRRPPGHHAAELPLEGSWPTTCRLQPLAGALSISGLYDLEPLRHTPFLQADLQLDAGRGGAAQPGLLSAPQGRQARTPRWAATRATSSCARTASSATSGARPRCRCARPCPAANHFTVLHDLADPAGRAARTGAAPAGSALTRVFRRIDYGRH